MAKPYSDDLRSRVTAALAGGETCRGIAERFDIAPSTVVKWGKRVRETGSPAPAKFGGHRKCSLQAHRDFVLGQIAEVPHLTLHRLKDLLAERGIVVSHDTVWRFLRREDQSFKKKRCSQASRTGLTSSGGVTAGKKQAVISPPSGWCLSTRPGSRPTWHPSAVGGQRASG